MKKWFIFYAKLTFIATYATFCTFCRCWDYSSSKRKFAWRKTCTVDKHTENSTLNLCLTPFERETVIWIIISKTLLNLTRYVKVQRYGALTFFTSLLYNLIKKKWGKMRLLKCLKVLRNTFFTTLLALLLNQIISTRKW